MLLLLLRPQGEAGCPQHLLLGMGWWRLKGQPRAQWRLAQAVVLLHGRLRQRGPGVAGLLQLRGWLQRQQRLLYCLRGPGHLYCLHGPGHLYCLLVGCLPMLPHAPSNVLLSTMAL